MTREQGRARAQDEADQIVFRWDGKNASGAAGFGPVAWSGGQEETAALFHGVGAVLRASGEEIRPALVRVGGSSGIVLIRRTPWTDPGGGSSALCHVLVGSRDLLDPARCLGLHAWTWEGADLPLADVRGELPVVRGQALISAAERGMRHLDTRLPGAERELTGAVAELLRRPQGHFTFLDRRGDTALPVLWGLYGLFGRLIDRRWTFATHDTVELSFLRYVFVGQWAGAAGRDTDRRRVDPAERAGDDMESLAARLVAHHLRDMGADGERVGVVGAELGHSLAGPGAPLRDTVRAALARLDRRFPLERPSPPPAWSAGAVAGERVARGRPERAQSTARKEASVRIEEEGEKPERAESPEQAGAPARSGRRVWPEGLAWSEPPDAKPEQEETKPEQEEPERGERPKIRENSERLERPEAPEGPERPESAERPDRPTMPTRVREPRHPERSGETAGPEVAESPEPASRGRSGRWGWRRKPVGPVEPGRSEGPPPPDGPEVPEVPEVLESSGVRGVREAPEGPELPGPPEPPGAAARPVQADDRTSSPHGPEPADGAEPPDRPERPGAAAVTPAQPVIPEQSRNVEKRAGHEPSGDLVPPHPRVDGTPLVTGPGPAPTAPPGAPPWGPVPTGTPPLPPEDAAPEPPARSAWAGPAPGPGRRGTRKNRRPQESPAGGAGVRLSRARTLEEARSAARDAADAELLSALRNQAQPYAVTTALVREIAHRYPSWGTELRGELLERVIEAEYFLTRPHTQEQVGPAERAADAAALHDWAVRPLLVGRDGSAESAARIAGVLARLWASPDPAAHGAFRRIVGQPGLPESVLRALLLTLPRPTAPRHDSSLPAPAPAPTPDLAPTVPMGPPPPASAVPAGPSVPARTVAPPVPVPAAPMTPPASVPAPAPTRPELPAPPAHAPAPMSPPPPRPHSRPAAPRREDAGAPLPLPVPAPRRPVESQPPAELLPPVEPLPSAGPLPSAESEPPTEPLPSVGPQPTDATLPDHDKHGRLAVIVLGGIAVVLIAVLVALLT
ncbi:hypothetical protein AB0C52_27720 [Streptomyces sp. NPDC048717]|uniref:hypothetical protein n=1 Tax=Streptomyces sp. NPDC048717 TaxID=3154928 RepID=UPI00343AC54E